MLKQIIAALAVLFMINSITAQVKQIQPGKDKKPITFIDRIKTEPRITDYVLNDKRGTPDFISFNENTTFSKNESEQLLSRFLPVRKNLDALTKSKEDAPYGYITVERYQQYFKGIKVEHGSYTVTAKSDRVSFMAGEYYQIDAEQKITADISVQEAFSKALQFVNASLYIWQTFDSLMEFGKKPIAELVFVDNAATPKGQRLAYKFDIYSISPLSRAKIYVDAANGEIILSDAIIKHVSPGKVNNRQVIADHAKVPGYSEFDNSLLNDVGSFANSVGTADTRYTGTRNITTDQVSVSQYRLRETGRTAGVNNMGSIIQTFNCATLTTRILAADLNDANNAWTAAEYNNAAKDNGILDAHWGAEKVVDYWWNIHGRRSIDNQGFSIKSFTHYSTVYDNAYWNGNVMTYGDGSGTGGGGFDVLTSIDVCAHEIGHGLCEFTANLVYMNESGAMNEGFSDIWAACVESYAISIGDTPGGDNKDPFKIGEEIVASVLQPLRSMIDPHSTTTYGTQPDTYLEVPYWYTGTGDNGGVHTNSGVLNHWFYVLCQGEAGTNGIGNVYNVTGIGIAKAEKIAYVTELNLSANSNYAAARVAAINAVIALYGLCSTEYIAVMNSWYAVGVGAAYGACSPTSTVQFAIATDKAFEGTGQGDCTYPSGTVKTHTINAVITLSNASTQATDATIILSGTATQGSDYTISPAVVTWTAGQTGSKTITITINDDNHSEANETIVLGYTLNANGGTATTGSVNQTETITLFDNDTTASTYMADYLLGDFEFYAGAASGASPFRGSTSRKRIQYLYRANELQIFGMKAGYISHLFLYIVGTASTNTFTNTNITIGTTAATSLSAVFATFATSSTVYSANYTTPTVEGFVDFPLASPFYWDGTSNIVLQICYDGSTNANNYLTVVSQSNAANVSTMFVTATSGGSLCGSAGTTTSTLRPDIVLAMYSAPQSTINLSRTAYLGPNADVSFYSASDGKVMARIVNGTNFDYGCTQVVVDRAGTGGSTFWRNGSAFLVTNKTFRVLPTTDNPAGIYSITLYYTKAEHDGWEAATAKDWETVSKVVKIKGHDISEVTPSTTTLFASVDLNSSPTRNTFGGDYQITAAYGSGFSGFAVGDPGLAPVPIKLISFTGVRDKLTSVLSWTTANEFNNDRFEIEASNDGVSYRTIGTIASKGNSTINQSYTFTDMLPAYGFNYYRLKQVDKDGQFTYSNIVILEFAFDQYVRVSPNPASDKIIVELGKPAPGTMFRIYSFDGKLVHSETAKNISRTYELNINNLAKGAYLLETVVNGQRLTQRFVKQ